MTIQCCKCKRVRADNLWAKAHDRMQDAVSHTYCPECLSDARAEIKESMILLGLRPNTAVTL